MKKKKTKNKFDDINVINTTSSIKLKTFLVIIILFFIALIIRLIFLQFVNGSELQSAARARQTLTETISAKRGTIYDVNGQTLAISYETDKIYIDPTNIKDENKETIAQKLSEILEIDYQELLEKINNNTKRFSVASNVEQNKVEQIKEWKNKLDFSTGIIFEETTSRTYPYNTLASTILGFTNSDNSGAYGIEYSWNSFLSGTAGKSVSLKDASQSEIANSEKSYIAAENGYDLNLTIDVNIQGIIERELATAVDEYECDSGITIAMDPSTGKILAMADYPNFDPNNRNTPNSKLAENWDMLSSEEKSNALLRMWTPKAVTDTYAPGSVFKLITSSIGLEENLVKTDTAGEFNCTGYYYINGEEKPIRCWNWRKPHGKQSLREALEHSCNPAFIELGLRIGAQLSYKYYQAFGLFEKTGISLPGEAIGKFYDLNKINQHELATMSFGEKFTITPIQMISAVSTIANDGVLVQPQLVDKITNTDTGAITNIEPTTVRQVVSKETSQKVKSMMESVVTKGTGGRGAVAGYSIGGKTGTSEPTDDKKETEGYVASYVAISPIEDTRVVLLLTLYKPSESNHQGGQVAGPVVSQMLTKILPELGIPSNETTSEDDSNLITVPDIRNKTITEAEKILKNAGFTTKITTSNDKNSTQVIDQVPKPGVSLAKNSIIMLYDQSVRTTTTVPDLTGKSASQATSELKNLNLNISITGSGVIISQDPAKGSKVDEGTVIKVTLKPATTDVH